MSATYLDSILEFHRARVAADRRDWRDRLGEPRPGPSLAAALLAHRSEGLAVVAEVKRRSPSRGWLAEGLDAVATARIYEGAGASAVSVLTDGPHFGGSLEDLRAVADAVRLPVLRKDFLLSENDVIDGAAAGAGAVLLIVAALSDEELSRLMACAASVGVDALVEVHTPDEARRAAAAGAQLVGVNQRDLVSFAVDPERAEAVVGTLAPGVVAVAESGFRDPEAARRAAAVGFDAILVGEHLVTSPSPQTALAELLGHPIKDRACV